MIILNKRLYANCTEYELFINNVKKKTHYCYDFEEEKDFESFIKSLYNIFNRKVTINVINN